MRPFLYLPVCLLLPVSLAGQARPARTAAGTRTPPAVISRTPPQSTASPVMIQVGGADWRFAHPFTTVIGGIDLDALAKSEIVRGAVGQILAGIPGGESAMDQFSSASGVTRALFTLSDFTGEPSLLVLLTGQVDDKALATALNGKLQVRRIDLDNVLIGTGQELTNAVARMASPAFPSSTTPLQEAKAGVDGHDFWFAGRIPRLPQTASVASAIHGFAVGFSLRKDLRLDVSLDTASAQMAQEMAAKARESQKETAEGSSLEVAAQGNAVRLRFAMDGAKLNEALAKAMPSSGFGEMFGSLGISPAVSSGPSAPKPVAPVPVRKSAVIYGLDEGPREVPMNRP